MMTGNCLGWVVYGYYKHDVFVVVANVPGLVLSIWLNSGASKLQYYERSRYRAPHQVGVTEQTRRIQTTEQWNAASVTGDDIVESPSNDTASVNSSSSSRSQDIESFIMVPQEVALMRMLVAWALLIMWVSWVAPANAASTIGIVVNINLVFFYGAPLQSIKVVLTTGSSETMHRPTVLMCALNALFWSAYGLAQRNAIILLPNAVGLSLSLLQGVLIMTYPRKYQVDHSPLSQLEEAEFAGQERRRSTGVNEII